VGGSIYVGGWTDLVTFWRFPKRGLRVAVSAICGLEVAMDTTFGESGSLRQTPDALFTVFTNRVENDNTLAPPSHGVGPCSEGWLIGRKSALQSTRSTATCPAFRGYPQIPSVPPPCSHRPRPGHYRFPAPRHGQRWQLQTGYHCTLKSPLAQQSHAYAVIGRDDRTSLISTCIFPCQLCILQVIKPD
jgi:hypothetical protein